MVFGTRPMETMSLSNTAVAALPSAVVYSTLTSFLPVLIVPTFTPRLIFKPCFVKSFNASFATCSSTAPRNAGRPSSTVTSAPRRRQTDPISRPITPAPITPNFFGTSPMRSAPSFDRTNCSSNAAPGSARAVEPVATMTCFAVREARDAPDTLMRYTPDSDAAVSTANAPRP